MSGLGFTNPALLSYCTPIICLIDTSFYNYRIDLTANIAFLVYFSIALVIYPAIWIYTRRGHFFAIAMILGLVTEIIGYGGRIWAYNNQWSEAAYAMQLICLTLAPAFFSAGIYVCLGRVVMIYGTENSRIPPRWYSLIFIPCDIIALLVQAVGAGIAAGALTNSDLKSLKSGQDIMTAGLSWQVFTLLCFVVLCGDFAFTVHRRRGNSSEAGVSRDLGFVNLRQLKLFPYFLIALGLASILVFWRSAYRVAELNEGFFGPVTFNQGLFIGFEVVLIVLAVFSSAIFHPAICLGEVMEVPWNEGRTSPHESGNAEKYIGTSFGRQDNLKVGREGPGRESGNLHVEESSG